VWILSCLAGFWDAATIEKWFIFFSAVLANVNKNHGKIKLVNH